MAIFDKRDRLHRSLSVPGKHRATGYIGTARVQLQSAGENYGSLSISVPDIQMRPPNLKIWAERQYTVEHGMTQDQDRTYMIGSEGTGLTSDTTITVYTEWLDHDDTPSGRMGSVTNDNTYDSYLSPTPFHLAINNNYSPLQSAAKYSNSLFIQLEVS